MDNIHKGVDILHFERLRISGICLYYYFIFSALVPRRLINHHFVPEIGQHVAEIFLK